MAFESRQDVWDFVKRQIPDVFTKRKFNFITIHYMYIMGMSFFISGVLSAIGGLDYIDSLFFAAGSCTQSGLNTVDVNTLTFGHQFVFYLGAMLCNPIIIHSSVVFVRLYWFERRFKDIVEDARSLRRSKSRTKTMNLDPDDPERARRELGVRGRAIQILRHTGQSFRGGEKPGNEEQYPDPKPEEQSDSDPKHSERNSDSANEFENKPAYKNDDDEDDDNVRIPSQIDPEQHIRFLEKQRQASTGSALYIPSPREFERGGKPEAIDDTPHQGIMHRVTTQFDENRDQPGTSEQPHPRLGNHITIDEPHIDRSRTHITLPPAASRLRPHPTDSEAQMGPRRRTNTGLSTFRRSNTTRSLETPTPYLSWQPTIGRNSFFVNLTEDQREELGGIEYRALKTLAWTLLAFFFGFHILGVICLVPWIMRTRYGAVVTEDGQGRPWWGVFTAASSFNDLGFTLTPDSMISFQTATFPLLLMTFLIIIGNTGFPCMLRFVIWVASRLSPVSSGAWEEFRFLLDHPRRCFTLLFPRGATWWLFAILVILNGTDLILFLVLDLNDETVTSIPVGNRIVDGLFQAASTRTAGFAVVNLAALHPAIQVSYLIMMYISVFPIAISMRRTNVYEEKSLGIYAAPNEDDDGTGNKEPSYVGAHVRRQLSFDLWYIFLGLFIIAIVEGKSLENTNEYAFTMFSVLFEIVSAYGTVGLSLGYPTINASFSAKFQTISKLVIIAMMWRGRHRGLPYELDRAVLLPSEKLHHKEAQEGKRLMQRRMSMSSITRVGSHSAVEGQLEGRFRAETGLSSAADRNPGGQQAEQANKHGGLGKVMGGIMGASDAIQEEMPHPLRNEHEQKKNR
jgi:Trk-type K+ transport system membrane component